MGLSSSDFCSAKPTFSAGEGKNYNLRCKYKTTALYKFNVRTFLARSDTHIFNIFRHAKNFLNAPKAQFMCLKAQYTAQQIHESDAFNSLKKSPFLRKSIFYL